MDHVSDYTKDEEQIILDLINHDNQTLFSKAELSIGPARQNGMSVDVLLTPVAGSGYGTPMDVSYRRVNIQDFMDLYFEDGLTLQQGDAETMADLLDEVNTALGTAIPLSSIVDDPIGAWEGTPNEIKNLNFTIKTTSRVYQGVGIIKLDGNDIPLASVISTKLLTGLNLPPMGVPIESIFKSNVLNGF